MNAGAKLGRAAMAVIGRELRAIHADIVAEGVPKQFAEINPAQAGRVEWRGSKERRAVDHSRLYSVLPVTPKVGTRPPISSAT